jgi:hypothetical protein
MAANKVLSTEPDEEKEKEKPRKQTANGKQLGEALTTDFNGNPMEVRKLVGGCLAKALPCTCKCPEFEFDFTEPKPKITDKKPKSRTISKAASQLAELRKAQEDLNKIQKDLLGVNHQVQFGGLSNDLEEIGTGVKYIRNDARGHQA